MDAKGLREENSRRLLGMLWEARELSRADLARRSGLARSTVSVIVADLLERDLVRTSHLAKSRGGRPPVVLRFNDDRYGIVGVDLGASHVTVLVVNLRGVVVAERSAPFPVEEDPLGTMDCVCRLVDEAIGESPFGRGDLIGAGLGVPSPLDSARPDQLSPRILPNWVGVRPRQELEQRLGLPVVMENDANLGALAEHHWPEAEQVPSLAYIKVSTGVGAGLIIDGRIFGGATGIAGEIGHTAIDASGPRCRCGLYGCLEAMVGAASLAAELKRPGVGPQAIARAALDGDPRAREVVVTAGRHLGVAVANLLNLLNPARVVLGGGITAAGRLLLEPLVATVSERALSTSVARAEVRISSLGDRAVALGAATAVLESFLADPLRVGPSLSFVEGAGVVPASATA